MSECAVTLSFDQSTPLYEQLYRYLSGEIQSGRFPSGERLPSKRRLSAHLGISMSTVETAYGILTAEGYIRSVPRSGYRVCPVTTLGEADTPPFSPIAPLKPEPSFEYTFSTGAVDTTLFPFASWAKISKEAIYQNPELLQRGHPQGETSLREELRNFLHQYRGVSCSADQILIGAGFDYLLGLVLRLFPGSTRIALENPGYPAAFSSVTLQERIPVPTDVDSEGMTLSSLQSSGASVAYVTPSHQFPLGITMPAGRRAALLHWAYQSENRFIIEDDYDSEFRYDTRPIPAMQGLDSRGRVIYMSTFSRSIAPSIRVAYAILPPMLLVRYRQLFPLSACTVSRFEQEALCRFISQGLYARHLRRVGNLYRCRCACLKEQLRQIPGAAISGSDAGLHFLFTLPGVSEQSLLAQAAAVGVRVHGLSEYYFGTPPPSSSLVLGYAGLEEEILRKAASRLVAAFSRRA
jgi:GntR family transcriptional regulator/MocR family aminotransferase